MKRRGKRESSWRSKRKEAKKREEALRKDREGNQIILCTVSHLHIFSLSLSLSLSLSHSLSLTYSLSLSSHPPDSTERSAEMGELNIIKTITMVQILMELPIMYIMKRLPKMLFPGAIATLHAILCTCDGKKNGNMKKKT